MTNVPHAIVDFAAALKMLAEAQSDIAEIVTKWDLICDTTTPRTVKIELSDGIHTLENLAKIRNDLVKGLSLENPEVYSIKFKKRGGPITTYMDAGRIATVDSFGANNGDPYEKYAGYRGAYRNLRNTFYSCCMAQKPRIDVYFDDLARFIWLGYPASPNDEHISEYNIYIKSRGWNVEWAQNRQYCTLVTFISANTSYDGSVQYGPVTLHLHMSSDDRQVTTVSIELGKMATFLIWAAPGQDGIPILRVLDQE